MKINKLVLIAFLLSGSCAPTIKNFEKYEKQFLSKTSFMPSKENLQNKPPKVAIFNLDENNNEVAKQAYLGISIASNIENILTKSKLVELVDRNAIRKLKEEVTLAEMNKTGSYKGPKVADYIISGTISNAGFTSKYSSGSSIIDPRNGRLISIPPKYTYYAESSGNIKIYEMPSLTVIEAIEFAGKKTRKENVQQDGGLNFGSLKIGGKQIGGSKRDDSLIRKSGEDAIDDIKTKLKNFFAKKGYILEKRIFGKKTIFKISIGSLDGIKQGNKFDVIGKYENENPITEEIEIERKTITSGVVSDLINPKTSWVLIDDEEKIESIRLGDLIKIKYKKGSFDGVIKYTKSAIAL